VIRAGRSRSGGNRATTYFPPIFIGIVTYLIWKRGVAEGR